MTALTLYFTNTTGTTLSTTYQLSQTHGVDNTNVTQDYSLLGTATGWGELTAQGTASAWAAAGSIGSPTGKGSMLEAGVLNLSGNMFAAGSWTANVRLCMGHTDGTQTGSVTGVALHVRVYKYNAGTYTQIIDMSLTGQTVNSTLTTYALSGTTTGIVSFGTGDLLYADVWAQVGTNTGGDAALNFRVNRISTNSTGDSNYEVVTPGYVASSSYANTILADSPLRYYRLNDASGTTALDWVNTAHNGTYAGAFTLAQSALIVNDTTAKATLFGSSTGKVTASSTGLPTGASAWSIEAWAKTAGTLPGTGTFQTIIMFGTNTSNEQASIGFDPATNKFVIASWVANNVYMTAVATINTTYHFVATYDGTNVKFYVNGTLQGTTAYTYNIVASLCALATDTSGTNNFFAGTIEEAAYYATALTGTQVSAHYLAGSSTSNSTMASTDSVAVADTAGLSSTLLVSEALSAADVSLVSRTFVATEVLVAYEAKATYSALIKNESPAAYYRLNETTGTVAHDSSGNGYNATLSGTFTLAQPGLVPGDSDTAILFDGTTGLLTLPYTLNYTTWSAFTLEFWSNAEGGVAKHIAVTCNGATTLVYVNGAVDTPIATAQIEIGSLFGYAGSYLSSTLDEVALYQSVLSPATIANHAHVVVPSADLVTITFQISEALSVSESTTLADTMLLSDALTVSENTTLADTLLENVLLTASDAISVIATLVSSENLTASDTVLLSLSVLVPDALTISETTFLSDTDLISDGLVASETTFLSDTLLESAALSLSDLSGVLLTAPVESLLITDSLFETETVFISESALVADSFVYINVVFLLAVETLATSDAWAFTFTVFENAPLSPGETVLLSDTILENVALVETDSVTTGTTVFEGAALSVSETLLFTRTLFESAALASSDVPSLGSMLLVSDGLSVVEAVAFVSTWTGSEPLVLVESDLFLASGSSTDALVVSETLFGSETLVLQDLLVLGEVLSVLSWGIDALSVSDVAGLGRGFIEALTSLDSLLIASGDMIIESAPLLSERTLFTDTTLLGENLVEADALLAIESLVLTDVLSASSSSLVIETLLDATGLSVSEQTLTSVAFLISDGLALSEHTLLQDTFVVGEGLSVTSFTSITPAQVETLALYDAFLWTQTISLSDALTLTEAMTVSETVAIAEPQSVIEHCFLTYSCMFIESMVVQETGVTTQLFFFVDTSALTVAESFGETLVETGAFVAHETFVCGETLLVLDGLFVAKIEFVRVTTTRTTYLVTTDSIPIFDRIANFSSFIIPTSTIERTLTSSSGQRRVMSTAEQRTLSTPVNGRLLIVS